MLSASIMWGFTETNTSEGQLCHRTLGRLVLKMLQGVVWVWTMLYTSL